MILLQNYADDRQKLTKIMTMNMFVKLDKAKLNTGNINGLNLAAVRFTVAPVSTLPLCNLGIFCCAHPGMMKACE